MRLEGSCHCGGIRFSCEAYAPVPYQRCYCSICRKTAGGGGYAINLGAWADSLDVSGREHLGTYRARIEEDGAQRSSDVRRHFCLACGSALWAFDPNWPDLVHPFASAIDTALPEPPERVHVLLDSRANWVRVPVGEGERHFQHYPDESLADWHQRHGLLDGRED